MKPLLLDGESLGFRAIIGHLNSPNQPIAIRSSSWTRIKKSSSFFDKVQEKNIKCYGLNTGFGDLIHYPIDRENQEAMQTRLVLSHAIGAREPVSIKLSKLLMLIRLNCFAVGASGIRPQTIKHLLKLYNEQAYPEIYEAGSLGASGDLAPLSHMAAFAMGKGWGYLKGRRLKSYKIHKNLGLVPLQLARKEGLSLVNGTSAMTAIAIESIRKFSLYFESMLLGMSLFLQNPSIPNGFLHLPAFKLKNHRGSALVARYLQSLRAPDVGLNFGSGDNVQAPYSFRCAPFILGTMIDSISSVVDVLVTEVNSSNDNPIYIRETDTLYHGGHFHGQSVSVELDKFRISAIHVSGLIDRQLEFIMDRRRNSGSNAFLSVAPELGYSGLEGAQYLVTSLHIENKILAAPVSLHTLPTNAGNQDYVSLGMQSAIATLDMAENLKFILGVYLFSAYQWMTLSGTKPQSKGSKLVLEFLKDKFGGLYDDSSMVREKILLDLNDQFFIDLVEIARRFTPKLLDL